MFGLFNNIWKNPLILNPILSRAQKEVHKSLLNNQKIHNNDSIFMRVQLDEGVEHPQIYIVCAEGKIYEQTTLGHLVNDPDLIKQLDALPGFIRKKIDLEKILAKLNRSITNTLGAHEYAKVVSHRNEAVISVYRKSNDELTRGNVSLKELLEADN